jgi:hypothetical protein
MANEISRRTFLHLSAAAAASAALSGCAKSVNGERQQRPINQIIELNAEEDTAHTTIYADKASTPEPEIKSTWTTTGTAVKFVIAQEKIGKEYQSGADLIWATCNHVDVNVPFTLDEQLKFARILDDGEEVQPGDLVIFGQGGESSPDDVAMILEPGEMYFGEVNKETHRVEFGSLDSENIGYKEKKIAGYARIFEDNKVSEDKKNESDIQNQKTPEVNILSEVPFFSQFSPELPQDIQAMGCGPVSLASELAYRKKISPNLVAAEGVVRRAECLRLWNSGGTDLGKMSVLSKTYGIGSEFGTLDNIDQLAKLIKDTKNPAMVGFRVDGDPNKIGHLLLVTSVDREKGKVYTQDTATRPAEEGENREYDLAVFDRAWASQGRWALAFGQEIDTLDSGGLPNYMLPTVLRWKEKIVEWSQTYELEPKAIATLMQIESAGNDKAVSSAKAKGLFQAMPDKFEPGEDHFDPDTNAKRGLGYFKMCLDRARELEYEGSDAMVEAARGYNGGIGVVGRKTNITETNDFEKFFRAFYTGQHEVIDQFYRRYATYL